MKRGLTTLMILLLFAKLLDAQQKLTGIVTDERNAEPLAGASVQVTGSDIATVSDLKGKFQLLVPESATIGLTVKYVGYKTRVIEVEANAIPVIIAMQPEIRMLAEAVVTATRNRRGKYEVPMRVDLVSKEKMDAIPALTVDDFLRSVPGIDVSRGASIFAAGHVSLRGMGNEPGRTLVMIDGVPVNKSDRGSVNWNAINVNDIQQIEVLKGPGSSIHGGNAMGGVINLITPRPVKKLEGYLSQSAGTFNTLQTKGGLSGRMENFYWGVNGMYRQSDGYITTPADEIDQYSVASFLDEYQVGGRLGYFLAPNHVIEFAVANYLGKRGTGSNFSGHGFTNDTVASPDGAFNEYGSINGRLSYRAVLANQGNLQVTLYGQRENFQNIRESYRDQTITRFDVESIRSDFGFLSSFNMRLGKSHNITSGIDVRYGAVDGADVYVTSTDQVLNLGKMNQAGFYIQDEISFGESPFSVLAGIRYDYARFYDGEFTIEQPTNVTRFLQDFSGELDDASFSAISPRISIQYHEKGKYRIYSGYSRGFRAPVLDDLCRTGRIAGGMKIANPLLTPEYIDNFEVGSDIYTIKNITISPSVFYTIGTDYHAFISTGDSIMQGNRMRPIRMKDNIGKVNIAGAELAAAVMIVDGLNVNLAYTYTHTEIKEFRVFDPEREDNLVGMAMIHQPKDLFHAAVSWRNRFVNAYVSFNYKGAQWLDDMNTEKIEAFNYVDLRLWRQVYKGLSASVNVYNLFDQNFIDSRNIISPGRMIKGELVFRL